MLSRRQVGKQSPQVFYVSCMARPWKRHGFHTSRIWGVLNFLNKTEDEVLSRLPDARTERVGIHSINLPDLCGASGAQWQESLAYPRYRCRGSILAHEKGPQNNLKVLVMQKRKIQKIEKKSFASEAWQWQLITFKDHWTILNLKGFPLRRMRGTMISGAGGNYQALLQKCRRKEMDFICCKNKEKRWKLFHGDYSCDWWFWSGRFVEIIMTALVWFLLHSEAPN